MEFVYALNIESIVSSSSLLIAFAEVNFLTDVVFFFLELGLLDIGLLLLPTGCVRPLFEYLDAMIKFFSVNSKIDQIDEGYVFIHAQ